MSAGTAERSGFARLLSAEWTKLRTVRGWLIGLAVGALLTAGVGMFIASATVCSQPGPNGSFVACSNTSGPDGREVTDRFFFLHRPLTGNGQLTVRITDVRAAQAWAKAGIIIKQNTRSGSSYAAIMVTPGHGVRMQYDFTHDVAGPSGAVSRTAPRWLRLTRAGNRVTGEASGDGRHWTTVGTATLTALPRTAQLGLFVGTPPDSGLTQSLTESTQHVGSALATARFDQLTVAGGTTGTSWTGTDIGDTGGMRTAAGGRQREGDAFTLHGSGDIGPAVSPLLPVTPIERTLIGTFAGLIAVAVVAIAFVTAEYRRGMVRSTLAASPRRIRVLAAKAVVMGSAAFVVGLAGSAAAVALGSMLLRANGNAVAAVPLGTELRAIVGTAALLAVTAILAMAVGSIVRHSAAAITLVIAGLVFPYLVTAGAPVLPAATANWVLRLSPAAGFAIQQTQVRYPQVDTAYTPFNGYFPLSPWLGFAVLCGYAVLALAVAGFLLRRRDA
ncbi:MAG TPA: ABC transporter permease subunit [Actinocatenispora sp.]